MIIEICTDGEKYYFKDKKMTIWHNDYGARYTSIDVSKYYQNDKYHNPYGPAIIYSNGNKYYYLNDNYYSYEEWLQMRTKYLHNFKYKSILNIIVDIFKMLVGRINDNFNTRKRY